MGVAFHGLLTVLSAAWLCQDGHFAALFSLCFAPAVCQVLPHLFTKNISLPPRDAPGKLFLPKAAPAQIRRRAALPEKGGGTAGFRFHPAAKRRANPPAARFALHTPAAAGNRRPQGLAICFLLRLRLTVSAGHGPLAAACRRKRHGARCKQACIGGVVRHAHHGAPRGIFAHKGGGSGLCLIVQPFEGLV